MKGGGFERVTKSKNVIDETQPHQTTEENSSEQRRHERHDNEINIINQRDNTLNKQRSMTSEDEVDVEMAPPPRIRRPPPTTSPAAAANGRSGGRKSGGSNNGNRTKKKTKSTTTGTRSSSDGGGDSRSNSRKKTSNREQQNGSRSTGSRKTPTSATSDSNNNQSNNRPSSAGRKRRANNTSTGNGTSGNSRPASSTNRSGSESRPSSENRPRSRNTRTTRRNGENHSSSNRRPRSSSNNNRNNNGTNRPSTSSTTAAGNSNRRAGNNRRAGSGRSGSDRTGSSSSGNNTNNSSRPRQEDEGIQQREEPRTLPPPPTAARPQQRPTLAGAYESDGSSEGSSSSEDGDFDEDTYDDSIVDNNKLLTILENTVLRPEDARTLSQTEQTKRKEEIEKAWERVRRWFWSHRALSVRAAACKVRGDAEVTPLHLICKLNNPPPDVIQLIIESAKVTASWADAHGWIPLHHACANGASSEVLHLLIDAYPEGKTKGDKQLRLPIHFYSTRRTENAEAMAQNVELLCNTGAAELMDRGGMLPMHYACAYGTNPAVLQALADAYPESLTAIDKKGRTPMHLAMVNAHRSQSPGVIRFLLKASGNDIVNERDDEDLLPLHLLSLGLKGFRADDADQRNNVKECLSMYLAAKPTPAPDFLTTLQDLPDWIQDTAVLAPHVRDILNDKIVHRFPTSILMCDGFALILLIVFFEIATRNAIDVRFTSSYPDDEQIEEKSIFFPSLVMIFIGTSYFLLREIIQVISLWSLGNIQTWFVDPTNWLDILVIVMTSYYGILMATDSPGFGNDSFRTGVAFTKGILWCAVISFLKSTLVDFAVFAGGVFYVVARLAAFMMAVSVILLAFAQMFYIVYKDTSICDDSAVGCCDGSSTNNADCPTPFPHCSYEYSLLKVYTMMMGEIGDETRYESSLVGQILYVLYAFLVVLLLSNVLIAIVTDSYEIIQNDRAAIVFWSNRLDFVAEMDAIKVKFIKRKKKKPKKDGNSENDDDDDFNENHHHHHLPQIEFFRNAWNQIMMLFDSNLYDDNQLSYMNIEFWCYSLFRVIAVLFVLPLWLVLGFFTAGWLWPPQVREYLFIQKETMISRSDIEKQKLEQLKAIQREMKKLKEEIRDELAADREQMARIKDEIDSTQMEVTADLQQVRELMTTLLDMGRQS